MTFVLDASTCLSWTLPDEALTETAETARCHLRNQGALVPVIWPSEVANALLTVERRGRLEPGAGYRILTRLLRLPVTIAPESCECGPENGSWAEQLHQFAQAQRLSSYDASYLLLAHSRGLPIASDDRAIRTAAKNLSVPVLGAKAA